MPYFLILILSHLTLYDEVMDGLLEICLNSLKISQGLMNQYEYSERKTTVDSRLFEPALIRIIRLFEVR